MTREMTSNAGPTPGPKPGPKPGATPGPKPGPTPGPTPGPVPGPGRDEGIDPDELRRRVRETLDAPAPTPADRAAQMEAAHALLQEALGGEGAGRG